MRVVADSHALVWYLFDDGTRLSLKASAALAEAERDGGIAVSVVSLVDLWYVTQTTAAISPATLAAVHDLLADPESALDPCRSRSKWLPPTRGSRCRYCAIPGIASSWPRQTS